MAEKEKDKPKPQYYTVVVEAMVPATIKYKVLAEDPEQALQQVKDNKVPPFESPKLKLSSMRKISGKVLRWGTLLLELTRRF